MDASELARLIAEAEQLSPERRPDHAIALNQRIVQLDPSNAAAYLRLARGYQAQRNFAAATAACQDALRHQPQSDAAQRRLQRITEEWDFYRQAQRIATFDEALSHGMIFRDQNRIGLALACFWRAADLSTTLSQAVRSHNTLAAAYRSKKDVASLDRAAEQYEWVLRQSPGNRRARAGLAAVLHGKAQMSQAEWTQRARQRKQAQQGERKQRQQWKRTEQKPAHRTGKRPTTFAEALEILDLEPPVTRTQIKRAYRTQAQVAHPDHGGSHAEMVNLNAAYELAMAVATRALA